MKTSTIMIRSRRDVQLEDFDLACYPLGDHQVRIQTSASFISAGTELAVFTGTEKGVDQPQGWCRYPFKPGYANVGRIVEKGKDVLDLALGQRVFTMAPHMRDHLAVCGQDLIVLVPENLTDAQAASARMAMVSMASLMVADIALNEHVAVFGLGAVGYLAAQLFGLRGAKVIGVDPSKTRRALADRSGVWKTIGGSAKEVEDEIKRLTDGKGVRVSVDAVGHSKVVEQAANSTMNFGQVVLSGSPRETVQGDLTSLLSPVHYRAVSYVGAFEWRLPLVHKASVGQDVRHSIENNLRVIYDLISTGRLKVGELVSHTMQPGQIREAYEGLQTQKDTFLGVVLDWTQTPAT